MAGERFTKVKKRDGRLVPFDRQRVSSAIFKAAQSVEENEQNQQLAEQLGEKVLVLLEERLRQNQIPEVEQIQDAIEEALIAEKHAATAKSFILYRRERERNRKLKEDILGRADDSKLSPAALRMVKDRYLLKDKNGKVLETPREMFERAARAIAAVDREYDLSPADIKQHEEQFFELLWTFRFIPSGRILAHAGTKQGQLYSSFVLPVLDSTTSIFQALYDKALIQRVGGGTGFSFSKLRPKGTRSSIGNVAAGPVSYISLFDHASDIAVQGGNRKGANMGSLHITHPDILDFITLKDASSRIKNFNLSVEITDDFMDAVKQGRKYALMDPHTGEESKRVEAREVFQLLVTMAWKCGDPGVLFIDRINQDNPLDIPIETTDPCGDSPLHPYDASHLGAINLAAFALEKDVDWQQLKSAVALAVRFLDNVIDASNFPIEKIEKMAKSTRRIGLGITGWADLLYLLNIPYHSEEALELADKAMLFIKEQAQAASKGLAEEKGAFPLSKKSKLKSKMRNMMLLCIAPAGARSVMAETSSGIEPNYALAYTRKFADGQDSLSLNRIFRERLQKKGLSSEELLTQVVQQGTCKNIEQIPKTMQRVFVTAHDIPPEWHIRMQAAFQKHMDQAVSKTINFPKDAPIKDIEEAYLLAYQSGCKGITVYRDGSLANQVLQVG